MTTIALFGAAGKMGRRISSQLRSAPEYRTLYVEADKAGRTRIREQGLEPTATEDAARQADVVILAIPDKLIRAVAAGLVPKLKSGAIVMCLDPAAPYGDRLPKRADISYFVTHPGHPPIFNDETDPEARRDHFGAGKAKQAIVCALMQGSEKDYALGESVARRMFAPILRAHRVTVEQMAMLEPAMSETVCATCLTVIREAMDEAIRRGVPAQAARDFLLGHIGVELAILFEVIDAKFSAGAMKAIAQAKRDVFQPDWKKVFEPANLKASVARITDETT